MKFFRCIIVLIISIKVSCLYAYTQVDSLIQVLPALPDSEEKVDVSVQLAHLLAETDYDRAIYYGQSALELAQSINHGLGVSRAYHVLAYTNYYANNYDRAMQLFFNKLSIDDSLGFKEGMVNTYNFIGNIQYRVKDYDKAHEYYKKGLEISLEVNYLNGIGNIYTNLGNIYKALNQPEKAEEYYFLAMSYHEKINDIYDIIITNNNLGNLYYMKFNNSNAWNYFKKALNDLPKIRNVDVYVLVYNNVGDFYLWKNKIDSAFYYLNKGLKLAKAYSLHVYEKDISQSLSIIYKGNGNFKKAFQYQSRYQVLNDSIFNSENTAKIALIEAEFRHQQEQNLKKIENLQAQKRIKTRFWIAAIFSIILIAGILIFIVYHRSKLKRAQIIEEKLTSEQKNLQHLLELRNKEIVIITMNLYERNELINHVIKKLYSITPYLKKINLPVIENIISELKNHYHENIIREFEMRFKKVHTNFYKQLNNSFPGLTSNELRLCAFLKMNMSTKDIASLTHQSINSIEVARTRLRKKLNLNNTDKDLVSFLSNI